MVRVYQLGALRLAQLHDGYGAIDGNRVFYPAQQHEWEAGLAPDPTGFMLNAYQPLLITQDGQHALVDTGFGEANPSRRRDMQDGLRELGVAADQITRVIITHAHGDHVGGNTLLREGVFTPAYPNAEYIVQEREIAEMRERDDEMWRTRFAPLQATDQLRIVTGEVALDEALTLWPMAGHTAGQQGVRMASQGQHAVFVGDLGLSYKNFETPQWGASWAWSREADEANRRMVAEWAVEHDAILILYHDPRTPWIRLARAGEGYRATPVA
jgi:glyoxylase-like metal-dependent hydrolase (beta-lactamase superfamily II)